MRLSVSNLAFSNGFDESFYEALANHDYKFVDIAPTKLWPNWEYTDPGASHIRAMLNNYEIQAAGMQSIFYGKEELNIFSQGARWEACNDHLSRVAKIAEKLGVRAVVFGSPKSRDPGNLVANQARDIAASKLTEIANLFRDHGATLCLEPISKSLGGRFLTTTLETANFVRLVDHDGLKLNLDTAALHTENCDLYQAIDCHSDIIGHAHASEPSLSNFSNPKVDHVAAGRAFADIGYKHTIAIEMLAVAEDEYTNLLKALKFIRSTYDK
jgi:D-psicose/D-tagatose/L-ribulose 3-epimerase